MASHQPFSANAKVKQGRRLIERMGHEVDNIKHNTFRRRREDYEANVSARYRYEPGTVRGLEARQRKPLV